MSNTQTGQPGAGGAVATPPLPDVNAETYPFDFVQHLLDQTANMNLYSLPEHHHPEELSLTPRDSHDWFGLNGGYGIVIKNALHRFNSFVRASSPDDLKVSQAIGESVGSMCARWLFCTADSEWTPDNEPPIAIFDPWRSQSFTMVDGEFSFGRGDSFSGYGQGRTYFMSICDQPQLLAAAVGNIMKGQGKFHGLEGTFIMTGKITPGLGFMGQISLRVVDPDGILRTERESAALTAITDPDPTSTYFVMRGEKQDRTIRTTFGPPPGDGRVSLVTPSQFRAAEFNVTNRGGGGIRTETQVGPVVCKMDATVYFDLLAPPGTAQKPVPFGTDEVYRFVDARGRELATVTARVEKGISFNLKFPSAPGQPGVRFAGFGLITGGTGAFAGAKGILTVNSLIGIAPHALTLMHVLHIVDVDGKFREGGHRARQKQLAESNRLAEDDPFYPLLMHAEDYTDTYLMWRRNFRRCSEQLSAAFAENFHKHLGVGEFPGLEIDRSSLQRIFEADIKPFDPETFNRYTGRAAGIFRTYELGTNKEIAAATLYSHWRPEVLWIHGRHAKKISGSFVGYFDPHDLPPLSAGKVDIILNSFRSDVGLTSWVEISQHQRQQRTSFAYKLPHPHEILWFVKDVSLGGERVENNIFMVSHEWKGHLQGKVAYFMVAFFYDIDFGSCTAKLSGDRYWRALYLEEHQ